MKNLVISALGVVGTLAWWSFTGGEEGGGEVAATLPSLVAGGGHQIEVVLETSGPVYFSATFSCGSEEEENEVSGREELEPGDHFLTFDVSGECDYAILEAGAQDPQVGAKLAWEVSVDGEPWQAEDMILDKPLQPNYAFFLQTGWEDGTLTEVLAWRDEG